MKLVKNFISKADEGSMRKEDNRLIFLMNIDTNILKKILVNLRTVYKETTNHDYNGMRVFPRNVRLI